MDDLFTQLGLTKLSDAEKKAFEEKINGLLDDRIMLRIATELSEEQIEETEAMEAGEMMENLDKFGIDLEKIAKEEGMRLREELLGNSAYMQGFLDAKEGG